MRFSRTENIYKILRTMGSQNNILGISFSENDVDIELIEWDYPNIDRRKTPTSKKKILSQVLSGLESVNESLGTNYKLSKIYFSPWESPSGQIYSGLIVVLIRHYHNGNEFKEV